MDKYMECTFGIPLNALMRVLSGWSGIQQESIKDYPNKCETNVRYITNKEGCAQLLLLVIFNMYVALIYFLLFQFRSYECIYRLCNIHLPRTENTILFARTIIEKNQYLTLKQHNLLFFKKTAGILVYVSINV